MHYPNNLYRTADSKLFDLGLLLEDRWLFFGAFIHPCQSAPPHCLCLLSVLSAQGMQCLGRRESNYSFRIEFSALIHNYTAILEILLHVFVSACLIK